MAADKVQSYYLDGLGQFNGSNKYLNGTSRGIGNVRRSGDYAAINLDEAGFAYAGSMEGQTYDNDAFQNWGELRDLCAPLIHEPCICGLCALLAKTAGTVRVLAPGCPARSLILTPVPCASVASPKTPAFVLFQMIKLVIVVLPDSNHV